MTGRYDLGVLDAQLEALLDLPLPERQTRLSELDRTEPALAEVLRKLLRIAADVETRELRRSGQRLALVDELAPAPEIPGYRIDAEIGRGGMAVVYAGHRDLAGAPQPVAIKLLRAALPNPVDRARFVNEQRILARLRHPHIATLLDVGVAGERPYMVLERIDGAPIDQRLSPTAADLLHVLDALEAVANALATAHAHLVIHRDIKPSNVLVDAHGTVKLIDFGIAKVLDEADGLRHERTQTGSAPLTLRYASPEQVGGRPVGVASDVYQFGLLAYRLLTGAWPWDDGEQDWPRARLDPAVEPVPPSRRAAEPSHRRLLAGDLDAIVLKCLRHAPAERYRSMDELRDDLARHRTHQPVLARRQTWRYRAASFARRHRAGVAIGGAAALLLAAGVAATAVVAARNAEHATRIARVLDTVTALLTEADPYQGTPGKVTVGQVADAAAERLLAAPSGDPVFDLAMLERWASLQGDLRNSAQQLALLARARALAAAVPGDAQAPARIAAAEIAALGQAGRYDEAERALADYRARWPGPLPLRLALNEARFLSDRGRLDAADELLLGLLARVPADQRVLRYDVLAERGYVLMRNARFAEALAVFEDAGRLLDPSDLAQRRLALRHRANQANAMGHAGRHGEAAAMLAALREEYAAQLGPSHARVAALAINEAQMLTLSAQPQAALARLDAIDTAALAAVDRRTRAMAALERGRAALFSGAWTQVMPALVDAVETASAAIGADAAGLAPFLEPLGWALLEFEENALAAAVAARTRALDPTAALSDIVLELAALRVVVPGRPDPGFDARPRAECDRVELALLRARLAGEEPAGAPTRVPADCGAPSAMRLEALGLAWNAPPGVPATRRMDSPLLARLLGRADAPPPRLGPAERARLEAWLASAGASPGAGQ